MNKFLAHDAKSREAMLKDINNSSIEELFSVIPKSARMEKFNLHDTKSEIEVQRDLKELASLNKTDYKYFIGAGSYKRFVPNAIEAVTSRFEFLSAYTPYQAEISQGTLEVMYDFQSTICKLANADVANASVYDGAVACAEAVLMAVRITKINKVFVSENLNPNYLEVVKTYLWAADVELVIGNTEERQGDFACVLYQSPNYFGEIEKMPQKIGKELVIACVDLTSLAILEPPNADIFVGDFQTLGIKTSFGGPYGGFMACKDDYKRQLPGRIVGKSKDKDDNVAYTLTLQAREQHIRREKATSNICSNQALMALCATLYIDIMGEAGIRDVANISAENAHILADGLSEKGYEILNDNYINEFVFTVDDADKFLAGMKEKGILAGIKLDNRRILTCTTELNNKDDIKFYLENC